MEKNLKSESKKTINSSSSCFYWFVFLLKKSFKGNEKILGKERRQIYGSENSLSQSLLTDKQTSGFLKIRIFELKFIVSKMFVSILDKVSIDDIQIYYKRVPILHFFYISVTCKNKGFFPWKSKWSRKIKSVLRQRCLNFRWSR